MTRKLIWALIGAQVAGLAYTMAPGWRAIHVAATTMMGG